MIRVKLLWVSKAIMFREELVGVIINKTLNDGQCGYSGI